ncbi:aminotransferase class I/II-fold pyridoxal phosphate-dependent enzyme [Fodinicola feengrottensis]|uniref:aminotransferase class I/II-fold pyridoxal phosphate-dependent enzyme n=1 Tax=Fodinicola feengrottensis TaxID=435914 RepID=UPI0024414EED|nr:aminotransferase class I/II-fold pyridoxal phosphate-dependent enzyme [Fodinicola feengrottensis]
MTGVALDPTANWALDVDALIAAIRPNTQVVSVNFPNNPTGKVIDAADFQRIAQVCAPNAISGSSAMRCTAAWNAIRLVRCRRPRTSPARPCR